VKLPERLKDNLTTLLVGAIAGIFLFFATKIYNEISGPFLAYVLPAFSNKTLLSVCSILALLVILAVSTAVYLYRASREPTEAEKARAFHDQFGDFVADRGVWTHKTKEGYFCHNCKVHLRESRMKELPDGRGWLCLVHECKQFLKNPDYKDPRTTRGATSQLGYKI